MDKARTITDAKTLWGEDPDKRNSCSASIICLNYSHFRVLSYLPSQFLHFFGLCMNSKNNINRMFPLMQFG